MSTPHETNHSLLARALAGTHDKRSLNRSAHSCPAHCSAFQVRIREVIRKHELNGSVSLTEISVRLKASRLAVNSALRAMERRGLAGYFRSPPGDQWSAQMWYLKTPNAELGGCDR